MNQLLQCRINTVFTARNDQETEFDKFHELVLLCDKASYIVSNEGKVVRQRGIEEIRFFVADANLDAFIEQLKLLSNAKPSELG